MIVSIILLYVIVVVFVATLIRSIFGFGESLIAVPLLAFYTPIEVAVPLSVLISITIAAVVVIQDWKKIHLQSAGGLFVFTLLGIPLGLLLLIYANEELVKIILGIVIIAFSIYSLFKQSIELESKSWLWLFLCGLSAGILGGAYGLNGPPLVVYGTMRRWTAQQFRATLQGYFLPASAIGMLGYWISGLWVPAVTYYYLWSLPFLFPAIFLGRIINHRLQGDGFLRYVHYGLIAIGILLLINP
ncbi:sulfite exporter TauE/SafE family protein [Albibacterium sp.]|uniref:sulfite exporter TauE/SafE family protein n=1 Tax=Albibacterium sp. TaxID=2952885 RepID=UPI002CDE7E06|nr:sulfite exporter TauE/SafE family protein [Albibacterium sp.]HUH17965.1 sulfite exporter TauE/SafE family protein [Albibacterium sp.]